MKLENIKKAQGLLADIEGIEKDLDALDKPVTQVAFSFAESPDLCIADQGVIRKIVQHLKNEMLANRKDIRRELEKL